MSTFICDFVYEDTRLGCINTATKFYYATIFPGHIYAECDHHHNYDGIVSFYDSIFTKVTVEEATIISIMES